MCSRFLPYIARLVIAKRVVCYIIKSNRSVQRWQRYPWALLVHAFLDIAVVGLLVQTTTVPLFIFVHTSKSKSVQTAIRVIYCFRLCFVTICALPSLSFQKNPTWTHSTTSHSLSGSVLRLAVFSVQFPVVCCDYGPFVRGGLFSAFYSCVYGVPFDAISSGRTNNFVRYYYQFIYINVNKRYPHLIDMNVCTCPCSIFYTTTLLLQLCYTTSHHHNTISFILPLLLFFFLNINTNLQMYR